MENKEKEIIEKKKHGELKVSSKMQILRQNYWSLYYQKDEKQEENVNQTEQEHEIIERTIEKVEQIISRIETADLRERRKL